MPERPARVAVVVPAHRVKAHVRAVLAGIGPEVAAIYVVDDACPEGSGDAVEASVRDPRVRVLRHERNQGVGGATLTGYRQALADGCDVIVKLDGDGQMDPALVPDLVRPILDDEADYVKGNRFFDLEGLRPMPTVRLIGNALLSFVAKLSTGYWDLFDPTNGFTAIDARVAAVLPFDKLARGYFFESDVLFRLGTLRAVVRDVPMPARYGSEESGLAPARVVPEFLRKHTTNTAKRIFYGYFLRNFSIASLELLLGPVFLLLGGAVGAVGWARSLAAGQFASSGTVMLAALPILVGVQLLLAFFGYDMQNVPREPLRRRLAGRPGRSPAP
jgi:glycosyltransferase involved in cell wall biosynthesis